LRLSDHPTASVMTAARLKSMVVGSLSLPIDGGSR
jgi:hypothetical protein